MMKKYFFLLSVVTLLLLTSCASILSGSKASVTVRNDQVTAPVTLSYDGNTEYNVFLPYTIKVKRGFKATTIKASSADYEDGSVNIDKKFNGTSLWNILWGAVPGLAIDAATGAIMKPTQNEVVIPMRLKNILKKRKKPL